MRACFHQLQPTPLVEKRQDSPVGSAAVFFGGVIDELSALSSNRLSRFPLLHTKHAQTPRPSTHTRRDPNLHKPSRHNRPFALRWLAPPWPPARSPPPRHHPRRHQPPAPRARERGRARADCPPDRRDLSTPANPSPSSPRTTKPRPRRNVEQRAPLPLSIRSADNRRTDTTPFRPRPQRPLPSNRITQKPPTRGSADCPPDSTDPPTEATTTNEMHTLVRGGGEEAMPPTTATTTTMRRVLPCRGNNWASSPCSPSPSRRRSIRSGHTSPQW